MKEEHSHDSAMQPEAYRWAAVMALPLRLVVGWTYFSAFWRRLVLENKLIPDDPGYIGVKFNHFLPNALGIKPVIEYLVTHPSELWWFMVAFTIIEFLVGLMLMLGLLTRLASVGVFCLALGILLGSGWLGTTCLDEWQIGILGMCAGLLLFLTGGGSCSLDGRLSKLPCCARRSSLFAWVGSGPLPLGYGRMARVSIWGAVFMMLVTLGTNQFFHGGVWGPLHNKSVKPLLEVSGASLSGQELRFNVF
ncbi:TQO small subunit DoxD, partial [Akkermansia sp.]